VNFIGCDLFRGDDATIRAAEQVRWTAVPDSNGSLGQAGVGEGIDIGGVNNGSFNISSLVMA
jgi:hypothetical protein